MDKLQTGEMVKYLGAMFPRWKVTPELALAWGTMFSAYPVDAVRGVINQHRANRSGEDPDMKGVRERLIAWREANPERVPESRRFAQDQGRTMAERCERYDAAGKEAFLIDGYEERFWPAMEECIQCWQETGDASIGTFGLAVIGRPEDRPHRASRWRAEHEKREAKARAEAAKELAKEKA